MTDYNKLLRSSSIDYTPDRLSQGGFKPQEYPLVCMDCANNLIMDNRVLVKRDEYERLKALEAENSILKDKMKEICTACEAAETFLTELRMHSKNIETEYKKLKKLDENVKSKIQELKEIIMEIEEGLALYCMTDDLVGGSDDPKRRTAQKLQICGIKFTRREKPCWLGDL